MGLGLATMGANQSGEYTGLLNGDGPVDPSAVFGSSGTDLDASFFSEEETNLMKKMSMSDFKAQTVDKIEKLADMRKFIAATLHSASTGVLKGGFSGKHHFATKILLTRFELKVEDSTTGDVLITWPYVFLKELCWDHAANRIRLTYCEQQDCASIFNASAIEPQAGKKQVLFILEKSMEVENEIMATMKPLFMLPSAPSVKHVGVITDKEGKAFERNGVQLAETAAKPTVDDMKAIIKEHEEVEAHGIRRSLALEHIHHGYQSFPAISSDGGKVYVVLDYTFVRIFEAPPSSRSSGQQVNWNSNHACTKLLTAKYTHIKSWTVTSDCVVFVVVGTEGREEVGDNHLLSLFSTGN